MSKEFKSISGRELPRFAGIKTFFRFPQSTAESENYDVGIVGVPFDGGASYRPGSRFAPMSIREVSSLGRAYHWERKLNFLDKIKASDLGDVPTSPMDQGKTFDTIYNFFGNLLENGKKFVAVGGDHSTTVPLLRAVNKKYGKVSLIHFDAHLDTYPSAWGCEFHHGTFLRHAVLENLIDPLSSCHIGLRGPLTEKGDLDFTDEHKLNLITVDDIRKKGLESFLSKDLPSFNEKPVYITFDIDCIDPSMAPGTGAPVVGGLSTYEIQRILRALQIKNLVGADVVEVSPPFDSSQITSLAAVDIIFEYLCLFASSRG